MLENVTHNILAYDPNTIGLIIGFIGALLITLFGLPPIPLLNEGSFSEINITTKMKIYSYISRAGLFLIALGFILQLAGIEKV